MRVGLAVEIGALMLGTPPDLPQISPISLLYLPEIGAPVLATLAQP